MDYRRLGSTGIKVSPLCLGTMTFGDGADRAASAKIYSAARDVGINFIDCANVYAGGGSEEILGQLIKAHREQVVISSKAYYPVNKYSGGGEPSWGQGLSRTHLTQALDDSLKRLKTDYIDVYYMHHFDEDCPLEESLGALNDFVHAGKIRYIGLSNFAAWQYMKAIGITKQYGYAPISCIQPMYSLLKRQCESEILPMAKSEGLGVFPYSPLGGGVLTGKYLEKNKEKDNPEARLNKSAMYQKRYSGQSHAGLAKEFTDYAKSINLNPISLAIAWVLSNPAITAPIIGGRNAQQLKPSFEALNITISAKMHEKLCQMSITPQIATDRSEEA